MAEKNERAPHKGLPAGTIDVAIVTDFDAIDAERQHLEAIREARHDRLVDLGLSAPMSFNVILGIARAVCSAERAVREFVRGQVAA